jgi:hypothetical protein
VQQFSEVAAGDKSVGDLMEGVHAVIYFPLDTASVLLGSHGSQDDDEMYRNVHAVPFPPPRRAAHAAACHVTQLQVMSICQMALSKGVEALVLCVNQGVNMSPRHCAQGSRHISNAQKLL